MTRVEKNKNLVKKEIVKSLLLDLIGFVVGCLAIIYYLLKFINNLVIKIFKKLPRLVQVTIVYTMIFLSISNIVNPNTKVIIKEKIVNKTNAIEETSKKEINSLKEIVDNTINNKEETIIESQSIENNNNVDLGNLHANTIYQKAIEIGLTKEQAILVVSISRHETGNWTSKAFKEKNNFGGIMCNQATEIKSYLTYEEGVNDFLRVLKSYYFDLGLQSIEEIGNKYCPVGAKNDPNGLNKYWVGGVTAFYNSYLEIIK